MESVKLRVSIAVTVIFISLLVALLAAVIAASIVKGTYDCPDEAKREPTAAFA